MKKFFILFMALIAFQQSRITVEMKAAQPHVYRTDITFTENPIKLLFHLNGDEDKRDAGFLPNKRDLGSYDVLPSAYITDAGLTLKGTVTLEGLQVRIENEEESIVYSSIMNIGRGEAQIIPLSHLLHGNYSLFLTIDEDEYVATFDLE